MIRTRKLWEDALLEEAKMYGADKGAKELIQSSVPKQPAKKKQKLIKSSGVVLGPGGGLDKEQVSLETLRDRGMRFNRAISPVITDEEKAKCLEVHEQRQRVVGTCQDLEKPYLRLTTIPNPATIRPPDVLERALAHILERFESDGDYSHALEQFKSIRQDLTVQGIDDSFAITVYEQNARTSLSVGDYAEFSQCQLRLFTLYGIAKYRFETMTRKQRRLSLKKKKFITSENEPEFRAYRLLYYCMMADSNMLSSILNEELAVPDVHPTVKTALDFVHTVQIKDYIAFYRVLKELRTNVGGSARHILKKIRRMMRDSAVRSMFVAHRPTLPIFFLARVLGFKKCKSCRAFLVKNYNVVFAQQPKDAAEEKSKRKKHSKKKQAKDKKKTQSKEEMVDVIQSLPGIAAAKPPGVVFKVF